jgi:hypothetical protein
MLVVKAGKRSLSPSSWYLPVRFLLASRTSCALQLLLIFCLRSTLGASWRLASTGSWPWCLTPRWLRGVVVLFVHCYHAWTGGPHCAGGCHSSNSHGLLEGCDRPAEDFEWRTLDVAHRVARAHAGSSSAAFVSEDLMGVVELVVLLLWWCWSVYGTRDPRLLQKRCWDPLVRGRDSVRCACVERAWRSLPTRSFGASHLHLGECQLWAHRLRHPRVVHCHTECPAHLPPRCEGRPCRLDDPATS